MGFELFSDTEGFRTGCRRSNIEANKLEAGCDQFGDTGFIVYNENPLGCLCGDEP